MHRAPWRSYRPLAAIALPQGQAPPRRGAGGTKQLSVTVSAGVAARSAKHDDPAAVIKSADRALYRAKRGGRNRVEGA